MASGKNIKLFLCVVVLGVSSVLFCPPKKSRYGGWGDLSVLRNIKPVDEQNKRTAVNNLKQALLAVGAHVWNKTITATTVVLKSAVGLPDDTQCSTSNSSGSESSIWPTPERPKKYTFQDINYGQIVTLNPVPKTIVFGERASENLSLAKIQLRKDFCRILVLAINNGGRVDFGLQHFVENIHDAAQPIRLFSQEEKLLNEKLHGVTVTFTNNQILQLSYDQNSLQWCAKLS